MVEQINIDQHAIESFCRNRHIKRCALFGSVLRADFRADSDVDVLVEFDPEYRLGFLELMRMQREFSQLIGREADFRTPQDIGHHMRDRVMSEAKVLYDS